MNSDRVFLAIVPLIRPWVRSLARRRRAQFDAALLTPGRMVFLGDSITEGGFWDAWFPELPALNRGIGGGTHRGHRRAPRQCDRPAGGGIPAHRDQRPSWSRRLRDLDGTASRLREILRRIRRAAPGTPIFLNSVMTRTAWFAPRLKDLNERHGRIAEEELGVPYVDLRSALAERDALRKEFTTDNLHLTAPGYRAWSDVLRPHVASFASR